MAASILTPDYVGVHPGDRSIDLGLAHRVDRQGGAYNDRFVPDFRREIAFMRDTRQPVDQAQGTNHLGGGGQERNYPLRGVRVDGG